MYRLDLKSRHAWAFYTQWKLSVLFLRRIFPLGMGHFELSWDGSGIMTLWEFDEQDEYEVYAEKIKFSGTRYEACLPFKQDHPVIPDNYRLAHGRLFSLLKRLNSEPQILHQYDNVIKEQLATGIVNLVNDDERDTVEPGKVHYIPHREVLREDRSTTKLRVVYDASSKQKGQMSLNECLLPGPPLTPLILDILLRFRLNQTVLVGDTCGWTMWTRLAHRYKHWNSIV